MTQSASRTHNARRNIFWGIAGKIVTILGPFIVRTFLIYQLGAEYLGANTLYMSILQVLSLAELGFAAAVVYSMYKPVAEGNVAQVAAYLNFFKSVYRWVGFTILILGLAVMPFIGAFVKDDWPADVNMQLAFSIYLTNTCLSYFLFAYKQSLLNAHQRNDIVSKVNMCVMAVQYSSQVAVLLLWPNFYVFAIVTPICTIGGNVAIAMTTKRIFPEYAERSLASERLSNEHRRAMRKQVIGLMMHQLCGISRNSFDSVIVSSLLGLTLVACYSNYFVVMSGVHAVLGVVCTSIVSSVGNSVATESKQKNFEDLRLFVFIYALASIACAAALIACYQPFMRIWVGEELMLSLDIPLIMTMYFYVLTMGDIRAVYVDATGIWWEQRWRAVVEAISNIALSVVLALAIGLPGVVLGTLTSLFLFNFVYGSHLAFKYYFGLDKAKIYYADHALYLIVAISICTVVYAAVNFIPEGDITLLLIRATVSVFLAGLLLLSIFCWTKRFRYAVAFVKRVLFPGKL